MNNLFKIVLYLRISNEDIDLNDFKYESSSISNQRKLLHQFIDNNKIYYSDLLEIVDDGYSGTNFKRPGIQSLFKMIEKREINCIIVKDLSRFGRNYIEVGKYIEKIFPLYNIRFISVNDNYDSFVDNSFNLDLRIKSIIHDIYSKDLSIKIKKTRRLLAQQGKFTAPFAPFGYKKSIKDKYKLEIDSKSAIIVKKIFEMALSNTNISNIVKYLNENNIVTPSLYRKNNYKYINKNDKEKFSMWTDNTVRKILKNEVYSGDIVYYKLKSNEADCNDKIIVKNMHTPIISKKDFELLQNKFKSNLRNNCKDNKTSPKDIFLKKLRCGICNHLLDINDEKDYIYFCKNNNENCSNIFIKKEELTNALQIYLTKIINVYINDNKNIINLLNKINSVKLDKINLFERLCNNGISEYEYKQKNNILNFKIKALKEEINTYNKEDNIFEMYFKNEIDKPIIQYFIKNIYVYESKVKIIWKFNTIY